LLVVGCWLLVVGCWLLVVGCWLLVVGCWLLVVGCWLLVVLNRGGKLLFLCLQLFIITELYSKGNNDLLIVEFMYICYSKPRCD
jgi:hypothetical protein